jgi:hypothetical protein
MKDEIQLPVSVLNVLRQPLSSRKDLRFGIRAISTRVSTHFLQAIIIIITSLYYAKFC